MVLFARVLAYNTALINYEKQEINVTIENVNNGNVEVHFNSSEKDETIKETIVEGLVKAVVEFFLTTFTSVITSHYALTGKKILFNRK